MRFPAFLFCFLVFSGTDLMALGRECEVTTIAGTGTAGFSGDGGAATSAELRNPMAVSYDSAGNLYIAEESNSRVRKVAPDGTISTIAGTGTPGYSGDGGLAVSAQLSQPTGVAVDSSGAVYIADMGVVRKIDSSGVITTIAGRSGCMAVSVDTVCGSGEGTEAVSNPKGLAIAGDGALLITDQSMDRVWKLTPGGELSYLAGNGGDDWSGDCRPAVDSYLSSPFGVAVDSTGNVIIADTRNHRMRKITTSSGIIETVAGGGGGIVRTGTTDSFGGDGGYAPLGRLNRPYGVAVDASGALYIADTRNHRIRRVSRYGVLSTLAGTGEAAFTDGPAGSARMKQPRGITLDPTGNIVFADYENHRVRRISLDCLTGDTERVVVPPSLMMEDATVAEGGGPATVRVSMRDLPSSAVTVDYTTGDESADAGSDYEAVSGTLTWAGGERAVKTFSVPILDDTLAEGEESFKVSLANLSGALLCGDENTVTVRDNERRPSITISDLTVDEAAGVATITVTLEGARPYGIDVDYTTMEQTALAGSDFTTTTGVIWWGASETGPKTFTVPLLDDGVHEGRETFRVILSIFGDDVTLDREAIVTLNDNDPLPVLVLSADATIREDAGEVTMTVTPTGSSAMSISVDFRSHGATATAESDFTSVSGTLTWGAGETEIKSIRVPVINDTASERPERFSVKMGNLRGATMTRNAATITISDDDTSGGGRRR